MSYRAVYAAVDAWAAEQLGDGREWPLLLWLARNTDDKSQTVIRSQQRLSEELGVSSRHVRSLLRVWKDRGVLRVLEHGGGSDRKPAKYRFDLTALQVFAMRAAEMRTTAEAQEFRSAQPGAPCGTDRTSGVVATTAEAQEFHSSPPGAFDSTKTRQSSGVEPQQRNESPPTAEVSALNSGSAGVPTLQRVIDSNPKEVASPKAGAAAARAVARDGQKALATTRTRRSKRPTEADIRRKVEQLARALPDKPLSAEQIAIQLAPQGITIGDIRRYYPRDARGAAA